MTLRLRNNERGAVLLLVLGAIAILSILAVELAHRASMDSLRTSRETREAAFRRAFNSGTEIAKALLSEKRPPQGYDFFGDGWANRISVSVQNDEEITVQIGDESGKFNIALIGAAGPNTGRAKKSLDRIFEYLVQVDPERESEWKDAQIRVRQRLGLEDTGTKPGPLLTLDGLREAGIPAKLVFGEEAPAGEVRKIALADLLTVFGDGKININTAHEGVLYALDEEFDRDQAHSITEWRATGDKDAPFRAFKNVKDLEMVDGIIRKQVVDGQSKVVKNLLTKVQDRVSVGSRYFSARISAKMGDRSREAWVFFDAQPRPANVSLYEEIRP